MALTPAERRFVRHWEEERGGGRGAFLLRYTLAYFVVAYLCSVALALFLSIPFIKLHWLGLIAVFSLLLALVISVWSQPEGHSLRGFKLTIGVDSLTLCGSAGDSPRPNPEMADFTPGTVMINFIACISILMDSFSEMLGTRLMPGTTEPSFISGMKAVPKNGKIATANTRVASVANTVRFWLAMAKLSNCK
jgi:hypothetical protein